MSVPELYFYVDFPHTIKKKKKIMFVCTCVAYVCCIRVIAKIMNYDINAFKKFKKVNLFFCIPFLRVKYCWSQDRNKKKCFGGLSSLFIIKIY